MAGSWSEIFLSAMLSWHFLALLPSPVTMEANKPYLFPRSFEMGFFFFPPRLLLLVLTISYKL